MYKIGIRLGRAITRNPASSVLGVQVKEGFFLDEISKFGISMQDLKKVHPTYDDLLEIYSELKTFGFSTKYLVLKRQNPQN